MLLGWSIGVLGLVHEFLLLHVFSTSDVCMSPQGSSGAAIPVLIVLVTNGLSHRYQLDELIFLFRGVRSIFHFYFIFR